MKFPFFFVRVDKSEVKQFREESKAVFDESFWGFANIVLDFFGDFMKMVEFIPDDSDEISH